MSLSATEAYPKRVGWRSMGESRGPAQRYVVENDQKVIVRRRESRESK